MDGDLILAAAERVCGAPFSLEHYKFPRLKN